MGGSWVIDLCVTTYVFVPLNSIVMADELTGWGSLVNGGPSGVLYGLIVAVFYYTFIGLSLAEVRLTWRLRKHANVDDLVARIFLSNLSWCVPLGHTRSWSEMGTTYWIFRWMDQLLWLDVWPGITRPGCR